jgi:hypothetical protein
VYQTVALEEGVDTAGRIMTVHACPKMMRCSNGARSSAPLAAPSRAAERQASRVLAREDHFSHSSGFQPNRVTVRGDDKQDVRSDDGL